MFVKQTKQKEPQNPNPKRKKKINPKPTTTKKVHNPQKIPQNQKTEKTTKIPKQTQKKNPTASQTTANSRMKTHYGEKMKLKCCYGLFRKCIVLKLNVKAREK